MTEGQAGRAAPPLVAHVIYSLGVGGLENGLVNLLNHMPRDRYRHAIVCLQGYTDFSRRLHRDDVPIYALGKREGKDWGLYRRLAGLLRQLRPDIVHTRNLAALEGQVVAAFSVQARRVHGEHGRDIFDVAGRNTKYNLLRRLVRPFVHRYTAVSLDLERWLVDAIGVPPGRISQIYNGVDIKKFSPRMGDSAAAPWPPGFATPSQFVVGSVGRMAEIKDHPTLVRAAIELLQTQPALREGLRVAIIGDGPTRARCETLVEKAGLQDCFWFAGEREDIPALMQGMNLFVLPSLGEGISNTILEAMATALPVVATRVGGNIELVAEGINGTLVPAADPRAMARAIGAYLMDPALVQRQGLANRKKVESQFSMQSMVHGYMSVYDCVLGAGAHPRTKDGVGACAGS